MLNKAILYPVLLLLLIVSICVLYLGDDLHDHSAAHSLSNNENEAQKVTAKSIQTMVQAPSNHLSSKPSKPYAKSVSVSHEENDTSLDLSLPTHSWKKFQQQPALQHKKPVIELDSTDQLGLKAGNIELSPSVDVRPLSTLDRSKPLSNVEGANLDLKITID